MSDFDRLAIEEQAYFGNAEQYEAACAWYEREAEEQAREELRVAMEETGLTEEELIDRAVDAAERRAEGDWR
jgi:hypothetical protein